MSEWWTTERGILVNIIKTRKNAQTDPFLLVAGPEGVVEELTFADIDNASDRAAWFLSKNLGQDEVKFFYMGRMDLRYYIWVLGAMKAGKCAVLPSPGNTVTANQLLFKDVGAKTLLFSPENFDILQALHGATKDSLSWVETPKYEDVMSRDAVEEFPFSYTFEEVRDKPFVALHTSGTTGHPKPIYWTHSATPVMRSGLDRSLLPEGSSDEVLFYEQLWLGNRTFTHFPFYHAGGMITFVTSIVCDTKAFIVPAPGTRITSENVAAILRTTRPDSASFAPAVLENMLKYPPGLEELSRVKHVIFGGGPMNPTAGEKLSKIIPHLCSFIGSTEGSVYHIKSSNDSTHWNSFKFAGLGERFEEVEPGLYELVYPRTELIHKTHLFFHSYPHLDEYRTKDLFSPAEGQPGWWAYRGRVDNWIAMSNGLKMDPKAMEDTIGAHPDVSAVMVSGERRFRLCLLIELDETCHPAEALASAEAEEKWRKEMIEKIWPVVEQANHEAPKFGRVPKELILFAPRDQPFSRSPKGSVQRRLTVSYYTKRIDEMYAKSEQGLLAHGLPPLKSTSPEDLVPLLLELYAQTLEYDGLGPDDDVFSRGLDSFAVATLSSRLKAALRAFGVPEKELNQIGIKLMYDASTVTKLANRLSSMFSAGNSPTDGSSESNEVMEILDKYEAEVQKLVETGALEHGVNTATNGHASGHVIAVTGTTGSLGSYILATLLARPDVNKVICLNRAADAQERQIKAIESRGLPPLKPSIDAGRVVFMRIDVGSPKLGLTDDEFTTLKAETTSIIHNAFPVNFLMTIQQFEPQLRGMLDLLEVVHRGKRHPSFLFVSSIGASGRKVQKVDIVPEAIFDREDARDLSMGGYGEAKFVCERMTHQFTLSSSKTGRPAAAAVLRVGQVAGPLEGKGAWNIWEWLPSLVVSSKFLGAAPATIGQSVDWIPVDRLAQITSDLVDAVETRRAGLSGTGADADTTPVYNIVNPHVTTWPEELLPAVKKVAPEVVPVEEWLARLDKTRDSSTHILAQNPGVKLAEFYKAGFLTGGGGWAGFATDKLVGASATAARLGPITEKDMARWIKGWGL